MCVYCTVICFDVSERKKEADTCTMQSRRCVLVVISPGVLGRIGLYTGAWLEIFESENRKVTVKRLQGTVVQSRQTYVKSDVSWLIAGFLRLLLSRLRCCNRSFNGSQWNAYLTFI
jgi:hypothetical protein